MLPLLASDPTDNEPIPVQQQWALWLQKGCRNARTLGIDVARLRIAHSVTREDKVFIIVNSLPTENEPIPAQQQWALWLQKGCGNARTRGIDEARVLELQRYL